MKKIAFQYFTVFFIVVFWGVTGMSLLGQTLKSENSTITSTTSGGNWSEASTWSGGVVPTISDDVIIDGDVVVDRDSVYCRSITIKEFKTLSQDNYLVSRFLIVKNDVNNYGVVLGKAYSEGYSLFSVKMGGNIETNGKWEKANIVFTGTEDNKVKMGQDDTISYAYISKTDTSSCLVIGSNARFYKALFTNEYDVPSTAIKYGEVYRIKIAEDLPYTLDLMKSSELRAVKFDGQGRILKNAIFNSSYDPIYHPHDIVTVRNTFLKGVNTVQSLNQVNFENVVIDDTLTVSRNTMAHLYVSGDLVNNGVVMDGDIYGLFTIHITGNLKNYGKWEQVNLIFEGTVDNEITMDDSDTIKMAYISKTDSASCLVIRSNAKFYGCTFTNQWELNPALNTYQIRMEPATNRTLDLMKNSLLAGVRFTGNGCILKDAIIVGTYAGQLVLSDVRLKGLTVVRGEKNIFDGNRVVIDDTLINDALTGDGAIFVQGNLTNNGVVKKTPSGLFMVNVSGNIINNGLWDFTFVTMNGTADQSFTNADSLHYTGFYLYANVPSATTWQWYRNDTVIDGVADERYEIRYYNIPYGIYYCHTDKGDSRKITITKNITGTEKYPAVTDKLLLRNYPNPFNTQTHILFTLERKANVRLVIYNSRGQQIAVPVSGMLNAGNHKVLFDGSALSPGIYYYRLIVDGQSVTKRMIFRKQ